MYIMTCLHKHKLYRKAINIASIGKILVHLSKLWLMSGHLNFCKSFNSSMPLWLNYSCTCKTHDTLLLPYRSFLLNLLHASMKLFCWYIYIYIYICIYHWFYKYKIDLSFTNRILNFPFSQWIIIIFWSFNWKSNSGLIQFWICWNFSLYLQSFIVHFILYFWII